MGYQKIYARSSIYITIKDAIKVIITLGNGTMLAKVHRYQVGIPAFTSSPSRSTLVGNTVANNTFIDLCLPFRLLCIPKLFNVLADMLTWILKQQGMHMVHHYLDDFLTLGPPATKICQANQLIKYIILPTTGGASCNRKSRRPFYGAYLLRNSGGYYIHGGTPSS